MDWKTTFAAAAVAAIVTLGTSQRVAAEVAPKIVFEDQKIVQTRDGKTGYEIGCWVARKLNLFVCDHDR